MELTISSLDYAPNELDEQTPFVVDLLRELPGDDRPDYWLAKARTPLRWLSAGEERRVAYLILAARWQGTRIAAGVASLPVGIAFVTDESVLTDARLDFSKCAYVAIGMAHDTGGGEEVERTPGILTGMIGRVFGTGRE
jgi:hypothetical protein